jgi:hypothetical protein
MATEWQLLFPGYDFMARILQGACTTRQHKWLRSVDNSGNQQTQQTKKTTNDKVVGCELKQQTEQTEDNEQGFGWLVG